MGEEEKSSLQNNSNNICIQRWNLSKKWNLIPLPLSVGWTYWLFYKEESKEREK